MRKIAVETPQVRDNEECFSSCIKEFLKRNPEVLNKLVERSFMEEKRRSKVTRGFFAEKAGLIMVFSVLIRAS
jgi:hypothetical protein